jgi:hypothetical protein
MIIAETPDFAVTSWGNGWAYALTSKKDKMEVFVQDDDAIALRTTWEAYETCFPHKSADAILALVWDEYSSVASPVGWAHAG